MSSAVLIPPPNSSSLRRRLPRLTARARHLLTAVNLHLAGVAALAVLDLYLLLHLLFAWQALSASGPDAIAGQQALLRAAQIAGHPLVGIDAKLATSTGQANAFYTDRLPYAYSQVLSELGTLTRHANVRLGRVQYTYLPVLSGEDGLTEVRMDASISGDYRPVVGIVNSLERDRMFFVITGITLTGQQTGQVNLRLRLVTYLRAAAPGEQPGEVLPASSDAAAAAATAVEASAGVAR